MSSNHHLNKNVCHTVQQSSKSLINIESNKGPREEPCVVPLSIPITKDTQVLQSCIYESNQRTNDLQRPMACNLSKRWKLSTRSNALV